MTVLTAACRACQGRGWLATGGFPRECEACTPTKLKAGRIVLDGTRVTALAERRAEGIRTDRLHPQRASLFNPIG